MHQASEALRAAGVDPVVRSGGSTPTAPVTDPGSLTEMRPGVYVQDGLAVSDQPLGDVPADAVAAFDRPDPVLVLSAELDLDGRGPFVWVHSDDHSCHAVPPPQSDIR
ncbi:hypothetical protein [Dactylosporangium sp. NPDC051484]|uniref:hypothetical protein n=1 Tax=Dactylosporangium sp. NPDC051484 TaxID=3154942 RepID=UPI00344C486B